MEKVQCTVVELSPLTDTVTKVRLKPQKPVAFEPGQYLQLVVNEQDKRPFSIANIYGHSDIELHIGAGEQDSYAQGAIQHLKNNREVEIVMPFGKAFLRQQDRPTILVAGGTGYSYVQSLLLGVIGSGQHEPVFLYWGVRQQSDLYALPQLNHWAEEHPWLTVVPVIEFPDDLWKGRSGRLLDAISHDFISLEPYSLYMAGRFDMVGAARELFLDKGILPDHMYADAFEFL